MAFNLDDVHRVTKKLCPVYVTTVEELYFQLSQFLHSCIGQASQLSV